MGQGWRVESIGMEVIVGINLYNDHSSDEIVGLVLSMTRL